VLEYEDAEGILSTYSIEEILNDNGLTVADALCILVNDHDIELPATCPIH
jgi:hypothetical protein